MPRPLGLPPVLWCPPSPGGADDDGQSLAALVLARRFSALTSLSEAELELLRDLADAARYHPPYRDLCVAGAPPVLRMVVAGWACRYRLLPGGRRQIVKLMLPGDFVGPALQPHLPSPYAVAALTELETVNTELLTEAAAAADPIHPGLAHAVRLMAHLDEVLLWDQIVRLGQQTACERFAHLMLELHERLGRVGLAEGDRFAMPLTQPVLADALGLSAVHVNRTVQLLRRDGLLDVKGGVVTLLDPERLQALSGWTPPSDGTAGTAQARVRHRRVLE